MFDFQDSTFSLLKFNGLDLFSLFPAQIQRAVLVPALEGRDLIARAKTGTGKTLAFGIPIIKRLTEDDEQRSSQRYNYITLKPL